MAELGRRFDEAMLPFFASRRRSVAVIIAVALGASACGSGETSTTPTLATAPAAEAAGASSNDAGSGTGGDAGESPAAVDDEPAVREADDAPPADEPDVAAPSENLFPDIDVVNIADGSTLNLAAELGGADRPTLLWFWAPH